MTDYNDRPPREVGISDPARYADLRAQLQREFRDQVELLHVANNLLSIVDQLVSRATAISPMLAVRAIVSGDYTQLAAELAARGVDTHAEVTDPTSGQGCPWTQAIQRVLGQYGDQVPAQVQGMLGRLLGR